MFSRKLKVVALAVVATGALAGSAQAVIVDEDPVRQTSEGYDFGGNAWGLGAPTNSGDLHFHHEGGQIRPHLVGALHLNDADGTCGRMKLEHYDADGNFLSSEYGPSHCVDDDSHHAFAVDMDAYVDNEIAEVTVRLQRQTVSGWYNMASDTYRINPSLDNVMITEAGVDFGGCCLFYFGQPDRSGSLAWSLEDGVVSPRLSGGIHLNNAIGVCARINLRYLSEAGILLRSEPSSEFCADDNDHDASSIYMEPYASNRIERVTVQLQTQGSNGSWNTAGEETHSIAD